MTYNGTWLLPPLQAGTPTVPFDLHVAPLPLVDGASKARSILAWAGFALPAKAGREPRQRRTRSSSTRAGPRSTRPSSRACSPTRRSPRRTSAIHDPVAREFLPMFEDAITPLDWLWEPEIDRRDRQPGPGAREGRHRPGRGRAGHPGRRRGPARGGSQLLSLTGRSRRRLQWRGMASQLLATKFYAPRPRSGLVPRPQPDRAPASRDRVQADPRSRLRPASASRRCWPSGWPLADRWLGHGLAVARSRRRPSGHVLDTRDRARCRRRGPASGRARCRSSSRPTGRSRPSWRPCSTSSTRCPARSSWCSTTTT